MTPSPPPPVAAPPPSPPAGTTAPPPAAKAVIPGNGPVQPPVTARFPAPTRQLPKFAFLKIQTVPRGAQVSLNGDRKGRAPLNLKVGMGDYRVKISSPGYHDRELTIKIDKMIGYPLTVRLQPIN